MLTWTHAVFCALLLILIAVWFQGVQQANAAVSLEYAARFNDDDSAALSRTPSSAGTNGKKYTISMWVKRGNLGITSHLFGSNGGNLDMMRFNTSDKLVVRIGNTDSTTDAVYRDPSAWLHVVLSVDRSASASTDKVKLYVNNTLQTFGTYSAPSDAVGSWNSTDAHYIGREGGGSTSDDFDGYLADVYNVDGQQLTPSSFGETDTNGYWRPKAYSGTYGTNGFHLDFASGSDLGNDVSGNNNDWTVNNLNATDQVTDTPTNAFSTGNSVQPSSGTFSNGNLQNSGTARSTFFMSSGKWYWEVYANGSGVSAGVVSESGSASTVGVSNGTTVGFLYDADNGVLYSGTSSFSASTTGLTGGRFAYVTGGSSIVNYGQSKNATSTATTLSYHSGSGGYFLYQPTTQTTSGGGSQNFTSNGTFTVPAGYTSITATVNGAGGGGGGGTGAWIFIGNNGGNGTAGGNSSFNSNVIGSGGGGGGGANGGTPGSAGSAGGASGGDTNTTGGGATGGAAGSAGGAPEGCYTPAAGGAGAAGGRAVKTYSSGSLSEGAGVSVSVGSAGSAGSGGTGDCTSGGSGSAGSAGSVSVSWTTSSSSAAPTDYKALSTANLPDVAIQKPANYFDVVLYTGDGSTSNRSIAGLNFQADFSWFKNRGASAHHVLIDALRSGFPSLFSNTTGAEVDEEEFMSFDNNGFTLKKNASYDRLNSSGYNFVSWNWKESATSGFDIVSYVGSGGTQNISHSLGVVPSLIIAKSRDTAGDEWYVYHSALGATKYLMLQSTAAANTSSAVWNNTEPTASVFTVTANATSRLNNNYIAYLFAEKEGFSKFGSYTGNGSSDGPFVYTGFKPRYLIIRKTSGDVWDMRDTARSSYNPSAVRLYADQSVADVSTTAHIDFLANGFKIRNTDGGNNTSSATYIYIAFAEIPFKYSALTGESPRTLTFTSPVYITGNATIMGSLSKGSGSFVIDHPLDPKNKLLYHSFVESPDAMNIYTGSAHLDERGESIIALPRYFLALNRDFTYQATPIGEAMPELSLRKEAGRKFFGLFGEPVFRLAGGTPNGEVSWMVTGVRKDPYILANPIVPEVEKGKGAPYSQGMYVHPQLYEK